MSELIHKNDNRATIHWKLLTGASALALTAYVTSASVALADSAGHPMFWIEASGDLAAVSGLGQPFKAPFMDAFKDSEILNPVTPLGVQKPPPYSVDETGKISFQPENSDWVFSASVRYGRSGNHRKVHQQTFEGQPIPKNSAWHFFLTYYLGVPSSQINNITKALDYADYKTHHDEKHTIVDFAAGKDVGLGILGKYATSQISAGVRMARFSSDEDIEIRARPDVHMTFNGFQPRYFWDRYHMTGSSQRDFHGVGPEISWEASMPLAGNLDHGEIALDWEINAALLFGKQKATVHHHTSGNHYKGGFLCFNCSGYHGTYNISGPANPTRARNVTVPNVGGAVGLSYRYTNAKIAIGYRYDTFLNAMDTGIDTAKKSNLTFNGPYASISIGLGD